VSPGGSYSSYPPTLRPILHVISLRLCAQDYRFELRCRTTSTYRSDGWPCDSPTRLCGAIARHQTTHTPPIPCSLALWLVGLRNRQQEQIISRDPFLR
jgi:hypothetical protein